MATLAYQQVKTSGVALSLAAANGGGDSIPPNANGALVVKNGGGSGITVTVVVPGNTKYGPANPDIAVSVAAGATELIGPLPNDLRNPTTGLVDLTYSGVTTVTVGGIQL
jgi:hypothetical protein